ncbi:MAG: conjugal transfer protein TrbE [Bacilli bacterium]|nr:conjugal transfer protein TrbE [Bacilli bacterium]
MLNLKHYRDQAAGLPDLLNYAAMIEKGIMLNKDGSLTAGFFYRAQDISSATAMERNHIAAKMNHVLAKLGNGWAIHMDASRLPITQYPNKSEVHFSDPITELMDDERREFFKNDGFHYETVYTMILTYMPPNVSKTKIGDMMFDEDQISKKNIGTKTLEYFKLKIDEFESFASNIIAISRMLPRKSEDEFRQIHYQDDLLKFINFALVGKHHAVNLPPIPMYMDSYIGAYQLYGGITPKVDNYFIGVVAIDGFPQESTPNMLDSLGKLAINYRWNTRFIFMDQHEALAELNKYRRKWNQKIRGWKEQLLGIPSTRIDEHALSMVQEIDEASAEINSGLLAYGYYTSNVILMDSDSSNLSYNLKEVARIIENLGFNARIETINTTEAWLGSLPGHTVQNVRRPLINSFNLSHLMPLSSIWAGDIYNECDKYPPKSPALIYAMANGSTPFRLNLHVSDIGHTLIFGPTGAGKSTLIATLIAQFRKYKNNQAFVFDKGNSLYPLTKAAGGLHYEIAGENQKLSFAPLAKIDSDSEQSWCEDWIETCLVLQGLTVTPEYRKSIHTAMTLQRTTESTSMTDFVTNIQNSTLKAALAHYTLSGAMGQLLDGETDGLSLSSFSVFEMEDLMNLGEKNVVPVLLYLFHRIEKALDGRPSSIWLDEAWIMLGHPVFKEKIREWLKVLRKANCFVVLATQSLSDAAKSNILDVLQESCPTKIFLPNPYAFNKGSDNLFGPYDFYKQFGLNDAQINIIVEAIPKREYYYVSPLGTRLFNLALGDIALSFVGASSKEQIKECKRLVAQYGEAWPYEWMSSRNVDYQKYQEEKLA